jgi:hypothetical protein
VEVFIGEGDTLEGLGRRVSSDGGEDVLHWLDSVQRLKGILIGGVHLSVGEGAGGLPLRERLEWAGAESWPRPLCFPLGLLHIFCFFSFSFSVFPFLFLSFAKNASNQVKPLSGIF